ncbi:MAG: tRNA-dihydrouridine synthase [Candidatus Thermoplasmatota archaeon]|nr:tRNA-dihydrouridine synthase [Candidatus Thermoplasmatota archaeon]
MSFTHPSPGPWTIKRGQTTLTVDHPIIAGPMAGGLDPPYRMILHRIGCPLSFTEMISARAVFEEAGRTNRLFSWLPDEGMSCAQIFGSDPGYLAHAASEMERFGHHMIDLNAGCPKRKVYRTGAGSALLKDPENLLKCVGSILDAVKVPVGIKMRMGFHHLEERSLKALVSDLQGMGISYLAMHPRTMVQQFSGKADRELIDRMSSWTDVPLIASGDVRSPEDIMDYLGRGAKAVMVARGLLGDPTWIRRAMAALTGGSWEDRYPRTRVQLHHHLFLLKEHLASSVEWYGEERGVIEFRPHFGWYLRNFCGKREFRNRLYSLTDVKGVMKLIDEISPVWAGSLHDDQSLIIQSMIGAHRKDLSE